MNRWVPTACMLLAIGLSPRASTAAGMRHSVSGGASMVLIGTIHGTETRFLSNPDVGAPYRWKGQGTVAPLGTVHGAGANHGLGFISQGQATGTITLSNKNGTITLTITYDETRGFAPLPRHGIYTIVSGTSAYAHASGSGSLTRVVGPCSNATANGTAGSCPAGASFPVTYRLNGSTGKHG
jgi:hypothetical protein